MQRRYLLTTLSAAAMLLAGTAPDAIAETTLRVFSGGSGQRPDLMRKLFDQYQAERRRSCSASI
jgi:multiple sugar transport system substrate-binding protein